MSEIEERIQKAIQQCQGFDTQPFEDLCRTLDGENQALADVVANLKEAARHLEFCYQRDKELLEAAKATSRAIINMERLDGCYDFHDMRTVIDLAKKTALAGEKGAR